ncbi:MAG TPA: hypothetical protein VEZ91_01000 [Kurthia gibsonii]|uniref:hypothetical protein n=1 Tax=Kurthia gibsonii TaxID=33946 RepID=UPI0013EEED9F|nr:hypothetical protein [Kurthia gibsonii]HZG10546.1 hypothetical protein [Kurthia gibsonii]
MKYTLYQGDNFVLEGTIEEVKAFVLEHEANCQHRHVTYIELNGVRGTVCDDCDKLL